MDMSAIAAQLQSQLSDFSESARMSAIDAYNQTLVTLQMLDADTVKKGAVTFFTNFSGSLDSSALPVWIGYCLFATYNHRKHRLSGPSSHWLYSLALSAISCVGGSVLASLLLGKKMKPLESDAVIPIAIAAWFVMSFDFLYNYLFLLLKPVGASLYEIYRANALLASLRLAAGVFPKSLFGTLLIPIVSVCGGGWIAHLLSLVAGDSGSKVSDFSRPSSKLRNVFWALIAYYVARDPLHIIFKTSPVKAWVANAAVFAFFQLEGLLLTFDVELSLFFPVEFVFSTILGLGGKKEPKKKEPKTEEAKKKKNQ